MTHSSNSDSFDFQAIAYETMIEEGFVPDLPQSVQDELRQLKSRPPSDAFGPGVRDLRSLLWSSIDDSKSRDLDQVECAEKLPDDDDIRVLVGIADVDQMAPIDSALDSHAARNGTSVYTGVKTFPMLPEELSTNLTSLVGGADRTAVIIDMIIGQDGSVKSSDVYRARIHNYAKLAYESVAAWLDQRGEMPAAMAGVPEMEAQIRLQQQAAKCLGELRKKNGALQLETIKAVPVLSDTGQVISLAVTGRNSARDIIENFMIAANVSMARFLDAKGVPALRRVVSTPERWPRIVEIAQALGEHLPDTADSHALADFLVRRRAADPEHFPDLSLSIVKLLGPGQYVVGTSSSEKEGHFGLAVHDYTHSTAPNRRYADLVTQRLVKAALTGGLSPYSKDELTRIAEHCTQREDAARKVERKMRKVGAAVLLRDQIGKEFDAIVTGASPKGTYARLVNPAVDGRIVRGESTLRVGDKTRVELIATDPRRGFIDFARVTD